MLFYIDYQRTIDAFKTLGINNFDTYFSQHQQNSLFDDFEIGKISSKNFIRCLKKTLPHCSEREIIYAWNAMLIGLPEEYLFFLENLSRKYRLFLLSNANVIHIQFVNDFLQKKYNLPSINKYFEKAYYSHEIGMRKPHKSTFEWVLKDANILAKETLFIDDTAQHIEGAKKADLKTHQIESNSAIISLFPDTAQ